MTAIRKENAVARAKTHGQAQLLLSEYMTQSEVAAELGTSTRSLARWRGARTGPPWMILAGRIMYRRAAVLEWLRDREVRPVRESKAG